MTRKEWSWLVGLIVVVAILGIGRGEKTDSGSGATSDDESVCHKGARVVEEGTLGAVAEADLFKAVTAGRNKDAEGLLALVGDGRVFEIDAGTKVDLFAKDGPVALVRVESGRLIGKNLYVACNKLNKY